MSRAARLQVVAKLAQQREDQAVQALAQVRAQLGNEQNRLQELQQYRQEYSAYLAQQGSAGIGMQQWRRTQGFIDQLDQLIGRQQTAIQSWQHREQDVLAHWREFHMRRKNISSYIDKLSIEEILAADKKEQKMMDELASLQGCYSN